MTKAYILLIALSLVFSNCVGFLVEGENQFDPDEPDAGLSPLDLEAFDAARAERHEDLKKVDGKAEKPSSAQSSYAILSIDTNPNQIHSGQATKITVHVKNNGEGSLSNGQVWIEAKDPNGQISVGNKIVGFSLSPQQTKSVSQTRSDLSSIGTWTFTASLRDGSGKLLASGPSSAARLTVLQVNYRPVSITSDNINNKTTDMNRMNTIASGLRAKGLTASVFGLGPNTHIEVMRNSPSNALIVNLYGGACAGTLWEMGTAWFIQLRGDRRVYVIFLPPATNITGLDWLPRAWDDNFSSSSFTGLAHPDQYLHDHGYNYIYTDDVNVMIENIIKEAIL